MPFRDAPVTPLTWLTTNTLLDVALRRRFTPTSLSGFTFVELMPQLERLGEVAGVPLGQLLTALNRKLEAYLDRDHQIGHAYFMGLNDVAGLRFAWKHKIVPLLQEYFYGDGEKMIAAIGSDFIQRESVNAGEDPGPSRFHEETIHVPGSRGARLGHFAKRDSMGDPHSLPTGAKIAEDQRDGLVMSRWPVLDCPATQRRVSDGALHATVGQRTDWQTDEDEGVAARPRRARAVPGLLPVARDVG